MITPLLQKNDKRAGVLIIVFSIIVFAVVVALGRLDAVAVSLPFSPNVFATTNAILNSIVSILLVAALMLVKQKNFGAHRNVMMVAMVLSILFLVSYICHKLFTGDVKFGDTDHNDILSDAEKLAVGGIRYLYYFILITHIFLAATILPFILFTAYRGLTGEYARHKKIARYTWPLWLYVSITGVVVYFFISPYYH